MKIKENELLVSLCVLFGAVVLWQYTNTYMIRRTVDWPCNNCVTFEIEISSCMNYFNVGMPAVVSILIVIVMIVIASAFAYVCLNIVAWIIGTQHSTSHFRICLASCKTISEIIPWILNSQRISTHEPILHVICILRIKSLVKKWFKYKIWSVCARSILVRHTNPINSNKFN